MNLSRLREINDRVISIVRNISLLESLSWPLESKEVFLSCWRRGISTLPKICYPPICLKDEILGLKKLLQSFTPTDPLEVFTVKSIESFITVAELVQSRGTPQVNELSKGFSLNLV